MVDERCELRALLIVPRAYQIDIEMSVPSCFGKVRCASVARPNEVDDEPVCTTRTVVHTGDAEP